MPEAPPVRRQLVGAAEVAAALRRRAPLRLLLARPGALDPASRAAVARAAAAGVPVRRVTTNDLRRMCRVDPPQPLLGLLGPDPGADAATLLAARGAAWLLAGVSYPGNAGFAIRTAEVSGADAIFLDAALGARGRKQALRASMHAERFFPVRWAKAEAVLETARRAGRRVLAVEDSGRRAPWELDLMGPVLFVIGGEGRGIPAPVLRRCDDTIRIPMAGFVPSYNLQAALAAVAVERLRQERKRKPTTARGGRTGAR